jgi:hypothetical protein
MVTESWLQVSTGMLRLPGPPATRHSPPIRSTLRIRSGQASADDAYECGFGFVDVS